MAIAISMAVANFMAVAIGNFEVVEILITATTLISMGACIKDRSNTKGNGENKSGNSDNNCDIYGGKGDDRKGDCNDRDGGSGQGVVAGCS